MIEIMLCEGCVKVFKAVAGVWWMQNDASEIAIISEMNKFSDFLFWQSLLSLFVTVSMLSHCCSNPAQKTKME